MTPCEKKYKPLQEKLPERSQLNAVTFLTSTTLQSRHVGNIQRCSALIRAPISPKAVEQQAVLWAIHHPPEPNM